MADITTETYQCFLDDAWDAAPDNVDTFRAQLRANEKAASGMFATVGSISQVAKNSTSQTYRGPGLGSYTMPQIQTVWRTLINFYDRTVKEIKECAEARGVQPDISDETVYERMKCWLAERQNITEVRDDVTLLRLSPFFNVPIPRSW